MEVEHDVIDRDLVARVVQAAKDLEEKGYAVVRGVLSDAECTESLSDMWDCLEKATDQKIHREANFSEMKATELLPHQHGILLSYRVNHATPCRRIRRHPRVMQVYATLYGTDQLTASMDRVNFKVPGKRYRSMKPWPHVDQDPRLVGRVTIQGLLTLTDASDQEDPGNRLYEGSHLIFEEFFAQRRGAGRKIDNWCTLDQGEEARLLQQCPLVKPLLQPGDLLLWDSRTVHSPSDGTNFEKGRFVVYVCYNKLWEKANDAQYWADKRDAFMACRASRHSPISDTVKESLFPERPRAYDLSNPPAYSEFTCEQLGIQQEPVGAESYLYGFSAYGGKEGCLLGPEWQQRWMQYVRELPALDEVSTDSSGENKLTSLPLLEFVSPFSPLLPGNKKGNDGNKKKKSVGKKGNKNKKRDKGKEQEKKKKKKKNGRDAPSDVETIDGRAKKRAKSTESV
jgi:hypothetical protein